MNSKLKQIGAGVVATLALSLAITSMAAAANFTASSYPVTYKASVGSAYGYVTTEAGRLECSSVKASATLSEASSTLTIVEGVPSGCIGPFETSVTVTPNGCTSLVHVVEKTAADTFSATVDLLCPAGKAIVFVGGGCETKVFPQIGSATVKLTNDTEKGSVKVDLLSSNIKYTVTKDEAFCTYNGTGEKSGGTFTQLKTGVISVEGKTLDVG